MTEDIVKNLITETLVNKIEERIARELEKYYPEQKPADMEELLVMDDGWYDEDEENIIRMQMIDKEHDHQ